MKRWWQKIQSWKSRRNQRGLQKWAQERTKGKVRFVIRTTLAYSVLIMMMYDYWDGGLPLFRVVTTHLTGIMIGFVVWSTNESSYKNALIEARVNAAPTGEIPEKRYFTN